MKDNQEEIDNLTYISTEAKKHLKNGVVIYDNIYRPFDMGVFGGSGYSLILAKPPHKIFGVRFGDKLPSTELIAEKVQMIVEKISREEGSIPKYGLTRC